MDHMRCLHLSSLFDPLSHSMAAWEVQMHCSGSNMEAAENHPRCLMQCPPPLPVIESIRALQGVEGRAASTARSQAVVNTRGWERSCGQGRELGAQTGAAAELGAEWG
ncbi:unnamed protein product [Lepidochelys kempii]